MKKFFATLFIACFAQLAGAGGLDALETYVRSAASGKAEFTQVVTSPGRQGQAPRTRTSTGTFEFARPGRFRFDYRKPFEQTIVADGQMLWLYDVDLNQVTVRKQAQVLGATPAALIASTPDLRTLQADFQLANAPDRDGLQWVEATPKNRDAQVQSVKVGFRGSDLAALEILDGFGQRSVLTFTSVQANVTPDAGRFQFRPPPGADILRQ